MVKQFLLIVGFLFSIQVMSQTGIGTPTPDASAKLDVYSTNKGFLPPRVTLISSTDNTTIPSPATGLLIYNTGNNAGLVAGYYYWNGTSWATIATASGSGVSASFLRGSRSSGQTGLTNGGTVIFTQVDNTAGQEMSLNTSTGQITLAAGRTYRLVAQVPNYQTSSGDARLQLAWYNETSGAYIGSTSNAYPPGSGASYGATAGLSETIITTTATTVISYRIVQLSSATQLGGSSDFPVAGSYPWFEGQVISGNTAVNGQSVDYAMANLSTTQSLSSAGNIVFNTIAGTGITLSSGGFNLVANKTYKLEAALGGSSGGYAYYAWVDNTNTLLPGGSIGAIRKSGGTVTDAMQDKAVVYYTPTSNITIYLRVISVTGGVTAYSPSSAVANAYSSTWASIQQVGSSAIINPWTLSGTNTFNTTGNVGIGTTTPASALDVNGTLQVSGSTTLKSILNIGTGVGAEGGQIDLALSQTTSLTGSSVGIDVYGDKLRIFENGGTARGVNIDLSKAPLGASGDLMWKASGMVNAGTDVTLGNLKVRMSTSGNRSLQVSTVSGTYSVYGSDIYYAGGVNGSGIDVGSPRAISTTPAYLNSGLHFTGAGNTDIWNIMDTSNLIGWRISCIIGASYNSNLITIERLF